MAARRGRRRHAAPGRPGRDGQPGGARRPVRPGHQGRRRLRRHLRQPAALPPAHAAGAAARPDPQPGDRRLGGRRAGRGRAVRRRRAGRHSSPVRCCCSCPWSLDCVDGDVARYTRRFSPLGAWLDASTDRLKEFACYAGLAWGAGAGRTGWLLAAAMIALQTARHSVDYTFTAVKDLREADVVRAAAGRPGRPRARRRRRRAGAPARSSSAGAAAPGDRP